MDRHRYRFEAAGPTSSGANYFENKILKLQQIAVFRIRIHPSTFNVNKQKN